MPVATALAASFEACRSQGERWVEPIAMAVDAEIRHRRGAPSTEVSALVGRAIEMADGQGAHAVATGIARRAAAVGLPSA